MSRPFRETVEVLLDEIHQAKYELTHDFDQDNVRIIQFRKHTIWVTLKIFTDSVDFDVYADLSKGIYELGDLHLLTRRMLEIKKICLAFQAREMNTTERLYPQNRQGTETTTSGL